MQRGVPVIIWGVAGRPLKQKFSAGSPISHHFRAVLAGSGPPDLHFRIQREKPCAKMCSKLQKELVLPIFEKLIQNKGSGPRDHQIRNQREKPCRMMFSKAILELVSPISEMSARDTRFPHSPAESALRNRTRRESDFLLNEFLTNSTFQLLYIFHLLLQTIPRQIVVLRGAVGVLQPQVEEKHMRRPA